MKQEFFSLVCQMRDAQKAYFRVRRKGFQGVAELQRSKDLERRVDSAISRELESRKFKSEGDLFADNN